MNSLDRWLLVNYVGYPYALNSLFPDNGLANLAGVLLETGRTVQILDFATVSVLRDFTSPAMTRRLLRSWETLCPEDGAEAGAMRKAWTLAGLIRGECLRNRFQENVLRAIIERLVEQIRRDRIQAVGLKLWNGDGMQGSARIAAAIRKRCPHVKIFGGGPHVDFFLEHILKRFHVFDALCYGEGEETIRHLCESGGDSRAYPGIPNLVFRRDGAFQRTSSRIIASLDDLPMPVYEADVYPAMAGDEKIKVIVMDESRGCCNNCSFCIHPIKSDHTLRVKTVSRLVREVDRAATQYGCRTFRFAGSCTPYSLLNAFSSALLAGGRACTYSSFAHVRGSEEADFKTIRQSGCVSLFFGVESGNQDVLNRMRKGIKIETIRKAISSASEAGVFVVASLIYPAPGDNAKTEEDTLALLEQTRPGALTVQAPLIGPRSDWFNRAGKYGIDLGNRARYLDAAFKWKVKILLPPVLWKSLPVAIDGKRFKRILKTTSAFIRRLEKRGFLTGCSDDLYLMSQVTGENPRAFRNESRMALFVGDASRVRGIVERVNARV